MVVYKWHKSNVMWWKKVYGRLLFLNKVDGKWAIVLIAAYTLRVGGISKQVDKLTG